MDTVKIILIILAVSAIIGIIGMLVVWSKEEPAIERKPEVGDKIEIVKSEHKIGIKVWKVKSVDNGEYLLGDIDTIITMWSKLSPIIYRLESDGKLYKW